MAQPRVDWRSIRPHGNPPSLTGGFEELSSQLVVDELVAWPTGTTFRRFGNPDGGREGRAVRPDGTVAAWQSKYLFALGGSELAQIAKSFKRAVETEPDLTDYYVLLPYDLPAGDTAKTESAHTKWSAEVTTWKAHASAHGLQVAVHYLGEHELTGALTLPSQAGRLRYWFDTHTFTHEWFLDLATRTAADAGPRYSPELHVDLPIATALDGLTQSPAFETQLRHHLAALRRSRRYGWYAPKEHAATLAPFVAAAGAALDEVDTALSTAIRGLAGSPEPVARELPQVRDAQVALGALFDALRGVYPDDRYTDGAASLYSAMRRAEDALWELTAATEKAGWRAAHDRVLLVTGEGGTGKTHLLCDVALARTRKDLPTVIVLGQHLDGRPPLTQIAERVHFPGAVDELLLPTLNAAAETTGRRGLIVIDALNESDDPGAWSQALNGLVTDVLRQPWLTLAVSCRTTFRDVVVPTGFREIATEIVHTGLAEATGTAVARYLDAYGIEEPTFPLLDPELSNPLFLRLLCEALRSRGEKRFPRAGAGVTWLYEAYLQAVDDRLSGNDRCDYGPGKHLVTDAVTAIAKARLGAGMALTRDQAQALTDAVLPGRPYSTSLFKGLLDEGVLMVSPRKDGEHLVLFGYERLGDITTAELVCSGTLDQAVTVIDKLSAEPWRHAGILEQLTVVLPEGHGRELLDVVDPDQTAAASKASTDLWKTIAFRSAASVSDRTMELAAQLMASDDDRQRRKLYLAAMQVATVADHPMNARWLHEQLLRQPLHERDRTWTQWCNDRRASQPMQRLLSWAWSTSSTTAPPDVRELAALALAWSFTSTRRTLRDTATKAFAHLLDGHPESFAQVLRHFADVDDPYVTERILAVGCGLGLRTPNPEQSRTVGAAVIEATLRPGGWPRGLLARDYARRAIEGALAAGLDVAAGTADAIRPPYSAPDWPPPDIRTTEEIEQLTGPPAYTYGSIRRSLIGDFGDFHKYVLSPAVDELEGNTPDDEDLLARVVFERVLEMGWTEESFGDLDKHLHWEPNKPDATERIGKKYQWIAFHETLATLLDHRPGIRRWPSDDVRPYDNPKDLGLRDLDPTVLLPTSQHAGWNSTPPGWTCPHTVDWDAGPLGVWLDDTEAVPDLAGLLAVTDADGNRWLTLEGHYRWNEELPPEDEEHLPARALWMRIRSYTFPVGAASDVAAWAAGSGAEERLPEASEIHQSLLADYPDHPTWQLDPPHSHSSEPPPPVELTPTAVWYMGAGTGYDRSSSGPIHGLLPAVDVLRLMDLAAADEFRWHHRGALAAADFAVRDAGPASVHVSRDLLEERAPSADVGILWTVVGHKEVHDPGPSFHYEDGQIVQVSFWATYMLDGGAVRLLGHGARRDRAGGVPGDALGWSPTASI